MSHQASSHGHGAPLPVDADALAKGHETGTASIRAVTIFVICFASSLVVVLILVMGIYAGMVKLDVYLAQGTAPASALSASVPVVPPAPRLQPAPGDNLLDREEMARLRKTEDAGFEKRGWVMDETTRKFVIPGRLVDEIQGYGAHGPVVERSGASAAGPTMQPVTLGTRGWNGQ